MYASAGIQRFIDHSKHYKVLTQNLNQGAGKGQVINNQHGQGQA